MPNCRVDPRSAIVWFYGNPIRLGYIEAMIVDALVHVWPNAISFERLENRVYNFPEESKLPVIRVHLYRIRRRIAQYADIKCVPTFGYVLRLKPKEDT